MRLVAATSQHCISDSWLGIQQSYLWKHAELLLQPNVKTSMGNTFLSKFSHNTTILISNVTITLTAKHEWMPGAFLFIMRGCLSRAEALYKWQNNILQLQRKKRLQHHLAWTCPWHKNWSLWCVLIKHLQAITPPPPSCPSCPRPSWLHLQMSSKGKWL